MIQTSSEKKAVLIGATGLVGGFLLDGLLKNKAFKEVTVLTRRKIEREHPKLVQIITNFSEEELNALEIQCTDFFSALGTTIKAAGSRIKFRQVDYFLPLKIAEICKASGCTNAYIISSVGADSKSSNFYLKTKGELEKSIIGLGFEATYIFQPSFLEGKRKETRILENLTLPLIKLISPLLNGKNKKFRPIDAEIVAKAAINCTSKNDRGVNYITYNEIIALTNKFIKLDI